MTFEDFADGLRRGEETLYLTTQETKARAFKHQRAKSDCESGHDEVAQMHPLLARLPHGVPPRPALMGNLVPQSANVWLGSSVAGASSGLHHDYHDNLYVLLRGCKRFQLWSPKHAENMYTHGRIETVHPNGRIVYQGQGAVRADGSIMHSSPPFKRHKKHYKEDAVQPACSGDSDADLEAILDRAIVGAGEAAGTEAADGGWADHDDYEPSDEENTDNAGEHPASFSRLDPALPAEHLAAQFPLFPGLDAAATATLHAGDMLYLPAGWFHNVVSLNEPGSVPTGCAGEGYHLAINYWFHPPDNLDATETGFRRPYSTNFWPDRWKRRRRSARG